MRYEKREGQREGGSSASYTGERRIRIARLDRDEDVGQTVLGTQECNNK